MARTNNVSFLNSIQTKLVLFTILIVTLVLGAFEVFNVLDKEAKLKAELNTLAESTSTRLTSHLLYPIWDVDYEQVEQAIAAEMSERRIYAITVRDENGSAVFAGLKRDGDWNPVEYKGRQVGAKELISSRRDIVYNDQTLGRVEVYISPKFIEVEMADYIKSTLLEVALLDLAIFLAMFIALKRLVIRPISTLAGAAEAMSKGDFDASIDLNLNNEIGQVASAMERMKASLKIAMSRMSGAAV